MQPVNDTTYEDNRIDNSIRAVVGDEKQQDFYSQVKLEAWDNESNFSIRYGDKAEKVEVSDTGVIKAKHAELSTQIYQKYTIEKKKLTSVRRVAKGLKWSAVQATSEYEMFNQIGEPGTMMVAHYIVEEPSLSLFDQMPAKMHLEVDSNGFAKDFNHADKSMYHPSDIPMPKYEKVRVCRFYTPYTVFVNPYYMDSGIHNIDIQWHGSDMSHVSEQLMLAIESALNARNITTKRHTTRDKLYFKHGDRWVKFFSVQEETGGAYAYINISSAYNKAFDFYSDKELIKKDVRDQFAYGLSFAYPEITHDFVNDVMQRFAQNLKVPLVDKEYGPKEMELWATIQSMQDSTEWALDAKRKDANWFHEEKVDGIELEIVLDNKPSQNTFKFSGNIPKDCRSWYQKSMSFNEQMKKNIHQPANVAGSFAIYNSDKVNNKYATGKIGHIYRPIAHDAKGVKVFCDFVNYKKVSEDSESIEVDLSYGFDVQVPRDFLDTATYPVIIDPTFGYTTAGGSSTTFSDVILGTTQQSDTTTGRLQSIYINSPSNVFATTYIQTALYNSSGNLIDQSLEYSVPSHTAGWHGIAFSNFPSITASANHTLSVTGQGTGGYGSSLVLAYDSTGGKTSYTQSQSYVVNTFPANLNSATTQSSRQYSIYAIYGYRFPIMSGSSVAMAASTRYLQPTPSNDTAWTTTEANQVVLAPANIAIGNFKFVLTTAPGAGTTRTISTYVDAVASELLATISNTSTSGSEEVKMISVSAGQTISVGNVNTTGSPASSTVNRWRMVQSGTNQALFCSSVSATSTTATRYMGIQDASGIGTTAAAGTQVMPESGTLQNFYLKMSAGLASGSYVCTLVKNGSSTSVSITLNSTNQAASYTAGTVSVVAGDTVYWQIVPTGTPSTTVRIAGGCEYVSGSAGNGILLGSTNANVSGTVYNNWNGNAAWNATESNVQALGYAVTLTKIYCVLSAAPSSTHSRTLTFRQNTANSSAAVTISGASTSGSWNGSLAVATDDLICMAHTSSGTPTNSNMKYGLVFTTVPATQFVQQTIML